MDELPASGESHEVQMIEFTPRILENIAAAKLLTAGPLTPETTLRVVTLLRATADLIEAELTRQS